MLGESVFTHKIVSLRDSTVSRGVRVREYDQMPRDLRAHGSPQPEPRLLPSDPYTSPRGGDVVSHLVTLLSPEWARYPRLSTADSTDSAVALLSQEPLVRTECLAGKVPRRLLLALHGLGASPIAHTSPVDLGHVGASSNSLTLIQTWENRDAERRSSSGSFVTMGRAAAM